MRVPRLQMIGTDAVKKTDRFPYAKAYRDRHGKTRWRFRKKGFTAELGTDFGSQEFCRRYSEAEEGSKPSLLRASARTVPGTLNELVTKFYQLHFPTLETSTAEDYRSVIEPLREKHGKKRVAHLERRHVLQIQADLARTPQQANKTLKRLSQMMELAIDLGMCKSNPVRGVKRFPVGAVGFHTWSEDEIAQFYQVYPMGTPAHLAMTLMLYTGAAKCDAVAIGRGNIRDGRLVYRRRKTKKNPNGIEVDIPLHPYLEETLSHVRPDAFTFLETQGRRARTASGLGSSMRKWCDKAGLPLCSSHGLRKAICRRVAEIEGDVFKVMAVSGHTDIKEAQKYCEAFGRRKKADAAIASLPDGANGEQNSTNRPQRFVKNSGKTLEDKGK